MLLTDKTKNSNGATNSLNTTGNFQILDNSLGSHDLNNYSVSKSRSQSSSSATSKASSAVDPNGKLYNANQLGTLHNSRREYGDIGDHTSYGKDKQDFWKFSVNSTREVTLSLATGSNNADIAIYNKSGKLLQFSGQSVKQWLGKGDYYALVYNYKNPGTSYTLDLSAGKHLSQYIKDYSVHDAVASSITDGFIDRKDMISILRSSKDFNSVNGEEVKDLRQIVGNAKHFGIIEDHVRVLANKVVNGNAANKKYQENNLGNLYAGSTSTHMEKLVGKWFLGNDRPVAKSGDDKTTYKYELAKGSLFKNGVSYTDVKQGKVGNCYFMAGLGATAYRKPNIIKNMFTDNGDGTFTVKFYKNGAADYVTVDRKLPTDSYGNSVYGNVGGHYNSSDNELWVALAEKAYAQLNESGWIGQDGTNSYQGTSGGWPKDSMNHITGIDTKLRNVKNKSWFGLKTNYEIGNIINAYNAGRLVTLDTKGAGKKDSLDPSIKVVGNHAYVMTGYNASNKKFQLYNPWGNAGSTIHLTEAQVKKYFRKWDSTVA